MTSEVAHPDETDLAIVHALQLAPRAPWARIGEVVGVDAATAARRWTRLAADGTAWLSVYPGRLDRAGAAYVEVDCAADRVLPAANALAKDPRVLTVEHVTGGRDLFLTVFTPDLGALSDFLLHGLSRVPGVTGTRTQVATRMVAEGSRWHLRVLDPDQRRALAEPPAPPTAPRLGDDRLRELMHAVGRDPRLPVSDLADAIGVSRPTARKRLDSALTRRDLVIRCELAQPLSGWPISTTFWAHVPPGDLASAARAVTDLPETRMTTTLTGGEANLMVALWLRALPDVERLETLLADRLPGLRVLDRAIALRHVKRVGHLLDASGRSVESVTPDPWWRQPS